MAEGDFTFEEALNVYKLFNELSKILPQSTSPSAINPIFAFLEKALVELPNDSKKYIRTPDVNNPPGHAPECWCTSCKLGAT